MQTRRLALPGSPSPVPLNPLRTGMPALDSIQQADMSVTAGGRQFRILRTTEVDSYESTPTAVALRRVLSGTPTPAPEKVAAALKPKAPTGDRFAGTARKAAKLSIGSAAIEQFGDLQVLIESLTADDDMISHHPPIKKSSTSKRVAEERRNVHLEAFLYAASRESDNDFHLVIGRDPDQTPELYMTAEVSGLPPKAAAAFGQLSTARASFAGFFGSHLPDFSYDFYDPPIPVTLEGSLFFDMSHSSGQRPGPASLKSRMPTIWEVHPVTDIVLG
jgi:hypothetical protein